ncbi:addiction module antitoxin RelB [Candidatus Uhrbacteria bacterium RIFOXYB2_FULL_45_11]|uniref:Addiction module antitoxin RelB n=1 Tax=Candidatus Uhrbacteria bacterium RIFOXYB2_FULL_45_11 TaxID=1802421 RepID=A0A1F7W2G4_9BACT|nr:MAG: addiction module antitoxin RelB [Candidatus Uhrbacteria bacterium RIFOXYB2_FULL_45_11]
MGVDFVLQYHELVLKEDIAKLSASNKKQIKRAIEEKLVTHPELYGKPLRQSLKGYRKLRVGDYRVIFRIEKQTIKILMIEHRSQVYQSVYMRIEP